MRGLFVILFAAFIALASACVPTNNDGRPACNTAAQVAQIYYRNNWDPTRFWVCPGLNQAAVAYACPVAQGFMTSLNNCVDFSVWTWTQPCEAGTA